VQKILVTGANGFVGSHICETLQRNGFQVRALVRKTSDLTNIKHLDLELTYGDLNVLDSLPAAIEGVEAVINNAGVTKALDNNTFNRVNAEGSENILKATERSNSDIKRFIQISSAAASGPAPSDTAIDENHTPQPLTAYGKSKLTGEKAVLAYQDIFPVTVLRPSAIYGPRDKEMLSFFKAVSFRLKPTFGRGECYINFTYVKDLAQAVAKALTKDLPSGGVYFVAEKRRYSYSEAADIISDALGIKGLDIHVPAAMLRFAGKISEMVAGWRNKASIFSADKALEMTQRYWLVDTSRIENDLGFVSPTSFTDGVTETVDWYRRHGWL
jgi:nucleoside-diphosphate-sugar epimerase